MSPLLPCVARRAVAGLVLAIVALSGVHADELADVDRLAASGQPAQALQRLEALLAERPRDPQLRFRRGVLLGDAQRTAEAMAVYEQLALDYPEIPEPHNNLAVLHAAAGDYDKARASLDAALRANPNYAVAHQNMGDLHALMARESYARALQLDPGNAAVPPKLALLRQLVVPATTAAARPAP